MTDAQVVAPIDLFTRQNVAPTFVHVISEASGMIGSPAPTEKGVKFKTLLDPSIVQNQRVRIQSEAINGDLHHDYSFARGRYKGIWNLPQKWKL